MIFLPIGLLIWGVGAGLIVYCGRPRDDFDRPETSSLLVIRPSGEVARPDAAASHPVSGRASHVPT